MREVIIKKSDMHNLRNAIFAFCKNTTIDISSIESAIQKKLPAFYDGDYYLEMYVKDKKSSLPQIRKQTETIDILIEKQGKNGYFEFADNPFITIKNIINFNNLQFSVKEQQIIIRPACEFLKSPNQSVTEKINAIELICSMFLSFSKKDFIKEEILKLSESQDCISKVYDNFFDKTTISCLYFAFNFLLLLTSSIDIEQSLPNILSINAMDDRDIISCLSFLSDLSEKINYNNLPNEIVASLFQLYVSLQSHKERDVKFLATKCLITLTNSKYQQIVLKQLSNCMDRENPEMKIAIIRQVKKIECDSSIKDYIIQKASVDNNYLVRDIAKQCKE